MAKKRKEEGTEKEPTVTSYDWSIPFEALECPRMFKEGLKQYILDNKLKIESDKDFKKIINDYTNLRIGG